MGPHIVLGEGVLMYGKVCAKRVISGLEQVIVYVWLDNF